MKAQNLMHAYVADRCNPSDSHRFLVAAYGLLRYDFTRTDTISDGGGPKWDATETAHTIRR